MGHPWPLFDLRIRTPHLELRLPTDDDLLALIEVARNGIVEPERTVFFVPWHLLPSPAMERQFLQHWWQNRGSWNPAAWSLGLAIYESGRPIGMQEMLARDFAIRKYVASGSWIGREYQGRGLGTEARAAILALAFDGLGADFANRATSSATSDPPASRRRWATSQSPRRSSRSKASE